MSRPRRRPMRRVSRAWIPLYAGVAVALIGGGFEIAATLLRNGGRTVQTVIVNPHKPAPRVSCLDVTSRVLHFGAENPTAAALYARLHGHGLPQLVTPAQVRVCHSNPVLLMEKLYGGAKTTP
jgi:hypothetical protein